MNIFILINTKNNKILKVDTSARRTLYDLEPGKRIEVYKRGELQEKIYTKTREKMKPYVQLEKEFIGRKQKKAEERNKRKKVRTEVKFYSN